MFVLAVTRLRLKQIVPNIGIYAIYVSMTIDNQ